MSEQNNYPNFEPNALGDLKKIARLPGMKAVAPNIAWGNEYKSWSLRKRLRYAERVAASMNHAADILQQERNDLIEVAKNQERQLKHATLSYTQQGDTMHTELGNADAEKQELYKEIVKLKDLTKRQAKEIIRLRKLDEDTRG
jgi:hypothetical protein